MKFFELTDEDINEIIIKHKYDCMGIIFIRDGAFVTNNVLKRKILNNLFEESDNTIKVVFDYWESEIDRFKNLRSSVYVEGIKFLNEIMEDYYRTVITDNWADEVGEKYYY